MAKYVISIGGHFECAMKRGWGAGKFEHLFDLKEAIKTKIWAIETAKHTAPDY